MTPDTKTRLDRIKGFVDDDYDLVDGDDIDWIIDQLEQALAREERYREALRGALAEAGQHLRMYVQSYKREPYDTGIMLEMYIKESDQRMQKYESALRSSAQGKGE